MAHHALPSYTSIAYIKCVHRGKVRSVQPNTGGYYSQEKEISSQLKCLSLGRIDCESDSFEIWLKTAPA